ncbi:MAG: hypothetical protein OEX14_03775 [Paracoccaceae bacterium]|nr:hypothetical protein [Paracoccaceae bacterium]
MSLRLAVLLYALLGLPATALWADDFFSNMPSYQRIASKCGADPSLPSYSASEYVTAFADAARATQDARKNGPRERVTAIQQLVDKLKECQAEEAQKFIPPLIIDCDGFGAQYRAFLSQAVNKIRAGTITTAYREQVRERYRQPAENCIRELMSGCIDPTKPSEIDRVERLVNFASDFGFIFTSRNETGLERFLTTTNPFFLRLKFCTDTDYACSGAAAVCATRTAAVKELLEIYIRK